MSSVAIHSLAQDTGSPTQNEYDGIIGGHEYVDLGLPSGTLWATYNIGASSPYEKGSYFAWGEVEPREDFSWPNYEYYYGSEHDPEKGDRYLIEDIGSDISGTEYDAARYQWGNGWRMPNEEERYELIMECWWNRWTIENGVRGVRIHGPNEHSIFIPVCGHGRWYGYEDPLNSVEGTYWVGVDYPHYTIGGEPVKPSNYAKCFLVYSGGFVSTSADKATGKNIRAVINPTETGIQSISGDGRRMNISYRNGTVFVSGIFKAGRLNVFDLSGRNVFTGTVVNNRCKLPSLNNGIYIVSVSDGKTKYKTRKITIR